MKKGGYQILDFKKLNFQLNVPQTISGIYDTITKSNKKALLLSGLVIGGLYLNAVFSELKVDISDYILETESYSIRVTNTDVITITEKQSSGGSGGTKLWKHTIFANVSDVTYFEIVIITTTNTPITYSDQTFTINGDIIGNTYYGSSGDRDVIEINSLFFLRRITTTTYKGYYSFQSGQYASLNYLDSLFPQEPSVFTDNITEL